MYWPEINNDNQLEELKKRNFFNLENEYSILKWSTKYKFLNTESSHLSISGHAKIAEELNEFLLKQEKKHKINLI
jgi:lysophospholipase L1-like esterase